MGKYFFLNIFTGFVETKKAKIQKIHKRSTNTKMNIIKTYAIIAVVCSHCGGGGIVFPLSNWVSPYFYFMPIFVFVSGYFYNEKSDDMKYLTFLKAKVSTLVVPYFLWNIFYGLINVILRKLNIISYGDKFDLHSLFIRPWIDGHQFHFNIAAWFLLSLFIDVIVIYTLRKAMKKIHILNDILLLTICFIISLTSIILAQKGYNHNIYLCITKAGFMLPYFQLGYLYKRYEYILNKNKALSIGIMFMLLAVCLVLSGTQELGAQVVFSNFTGNPILITISTVLSILLTATVCEILSPAFENNKIMNNIGDNTFSIMMHHGFIIFMVNFTLYILSNFINLPSFNVLNFQKTLWYVFPASDSKTCIMYTVLGIAVPLLIKSLYDKLILYTYQKFLKKNKN